MAYYTLGGLTCWGKAPNHKTVRNLFPDNPMALCPSLDLELSDPEFWCRNDPAAQNFSPWAPLFQSIISNINSDPISKLPNPDIQSRTAVLQPTDLNSDTEIHVERRLEEANSQHFQGTSDLIRMLYFRRPRG